MKKRLFLTLAAAGLTAASALAQGNGLTGITEATSMVTSYFDPLTRLIYAVGAVVGLIGGIKVYQKSAQETQTPLRQRLRGSGPAFF